MFENLDFFSINWREQMENLRALAHLLEEMIEKCKSENDRDPALIRRLVENRHESLLLFERKEKEMDREREGTTSEVFIAMIIVEVRIKIARKCLFRNNSDI